MKENKIVRIMTVFALISTLLFSITALKLSPGHDYSLEAVRIERTEGELLPGMEEKSGGHYINMKEYVISESSSHQISSPKPPAAVTQQPQPEPSEHRFPMDINTATMQDLMQVKGIGEKKAQDILDYRQRRGRIKTMQELTEVKGIGEKTLQKLCQMFYVG